MIADSKHWDDHLDNTKLKARQLKANMNLLLERQLSELNEMLHTGKLQPKFTLRKLPMWG